MVISTARPHHFTSVFAIGYFKGPAAIHCLAGFTVNNNLDLIETGLDR